MPRVALVLLVLALPGLAQAACKKPVSAAELKTTLKAAEGAFARVDIDAFNEQMTRARQQVVCLSEEISPSLAAELHRMEGLAAFASSARDKAAAAFAAARRIEPDSKLSTDVVPEGNPIHDFYTAKDPMCEEEQIPPAKGGKLRVNGEAQRRLPTELPAVVQVIDPRGGDDITQYHWPGDELTYPPGSVRTPLQNGLLVGGAAVAAVGLGTLLVGQASTGTTTEDFPADILDASRRRSTMSGAGAGIIGAGLVSVGVSFALPNKDAAQ